MGGVIITKTWVAVEIKKCGICKYPVFVNPVTESYFCLDCDEFNPPVLPVSEGEVLRV